VRLYSLSLLRIAIGVANWNEEKAITTVRDRRTSVTYYYTERNVEGCILQTTSCVRLYSLSLLRIAIGVANWNEEKAITTVRDNMYIITVTV
jgi:hypothetical protein